MPEHGICTKTDRTAVRSRKMDIRGPRVGDTNPVHAFTLGPLIKRVNGRTRLKNASSMG
jgi:hypothetical protein